MMLFSIILLFASTLIQGIASNYLGYTYNSLSIFSTIYVLITLLILNPYFINKKKYFTLLIIFGLIYDIVFANTFILNTCLFILAYYISKSFHFFFPYNWLTISISNLISVFTCHLLSFIFLNLLSYDNYSLFYLLKGFGCNILMTIIFSFLVYTFVSFIKNKFQLKEIK